MSGQRVTNEQARLLVESIEATACMRDLGGAPRGFSRDEDETRAVALDLLDCRAKAEALAGAGDELLFELRGPTDQVTPMGLSRAADRLTAALAAWREGK